MENSINWAAYMALAKTAVHHKPAPYIRDEESAAEAVGPTQAQVIAMSRNLDALDVRATEFITQCQDELRYVQSRGMWLYWDTNVWKWDTTGKAQELAKDFGRSFLAPVLAGTDEGNKLRLKWYKTLTEPKGINDLLSLAKTDPMLAASPEQFDAGTLELNTPAGIVNLRTGEIAKPTPNKLVKRSTSVAPDSGCATTFYKNLLSDAFMGQPELSAYFETMMGVSLIKGQQEQVFLYMFGKAGSGKGTLMNIANDILGTGEDGYAANVDSELFVASRQKQHPTELMQFLGARMVISSEITQGQRMDTGKLKKVTGGDSITGRYMGKDFVTFDPTHTLWIMANDRLQVPHDDQGVWRRLRVIPFNFAKKESEQASGLYERIMATEAPGILARWVSKATEYLEYGITTPDSVLAARDEYILEQDTVQEWIEAICDKENPSAFCSSEALRESYLKWCSREKRTALGPKKFSLDLVDKGYIRDTQRTLDTPQSVTERQCRGFLGLTISHSVTVHP